mgnify:CR=1 FL=1
MNMMSLFSLFALSMGENINDTCSVAKNGTCSSARTPVFGDLCQVSNNFTECSSYSIQVPEDFYEEEVVPPSCSGVLECEKILNEKGGKAAKDQFLSSLFFQAIFVYCSCIYYRRILDGLEFLRDNIEIIFSIWFTIMKCITYMFLLAVSIAVIITAMNDHEKQETVLKIMSFVCFLDHMDGGNNNDNDDENLTEEEEYQRWRRRRDRYN